MPASRPRPPRLPTWGLFLAIFGTVLFCYWPALSGGILWDDPAHIPPPDMQGWIGLQRIWTDLRATQQYYPVLFSAFWLEHHLWGNHTLGYHLVNVVFHTASCCVLALLLRRLWVPPASGPLRDQPQTTTVPAGAEWLVALLFAVHPMCVESVAWITEQKNTLSLLFYLLAGYFYVDFAETRRKGLYLLASGLFLFALGSKTITATLPAALLVILWWKQGRLSWRKDVLPLVPWFLCSIALGLLTSWVERKIIGAEGTAFELSTVERLLLANRAVWFYVGKLVWPADLMFFYPRWDVAATGYAWTGYAVATLALTAILWSCRGRTRGPLAGWLLFVGGLTPILGFFKVFFFKFSYVNDHFAYLASVGFIGTAVGGATFLLARSPRGWRTTGWVAFAFLAGTLAVLSRQQSRLYRDNETLARAAIARNPSAWMAHQILAVTLSKAPDRHEEAIAEYREVLRLKPDHPDAHFGLGVELARLPGRKAEAIAEYERAVELRPIYAEAHNNLAFELAKQPGRTAEVIAHYEAALRFKPDFAEAHANLADTLAKSPDRLPEALAHYEEALRFKPGLEWVHCHLAFQLAHIPGREREAISHYEAALRTQPNFLDAHNGLGILYAQLGELGKARAQWETALQIDPGYEAARRNLLLLDQVPAP